MKIGIKECTHNEILHQYQKNIKMLRASVSGKKRTPVCKKREIKIK